jgi:hypothetical protein
LTLNWNANPSISLKNSDYSSKSLMAFLMLFLVLRVASWVVRAPPVTLADFTDYIFTRRKVLTETTKFIRCVFQGCRATSILYTDTNGGAVYMENTSADLGFSGCLFEDCWAFDYGGSVYVRCQSFSMTETIANNCSSQTGSSCDDIETWSPTQGSIGVREVTVVSSRCPSEVTFRCCYSLYSSSSGNITRIDSVNSSANYATQGGRPSTFIGISHCPFTSARFLEMRLPTVCF